MNLLNSSSLRRITDMDDYEEVKNLKDNKKQLKHKIHFGNLVGEQAKKESALIDQTLQELSHSQHLHRYQSEQSLRAKAKIAKVKKHILSKDTSDNYYYSQLSKNKDWKGKYEHKAWFIHQKTNNYKSLDKFLAYRDQLQKQSMYEYSQQRMDDSTKIDSSRDAPLPRHVSSCRIRNTDNLIQSISYYDQIYSQPKDTLNLPKINEAVLNHPHDHSLALNTVTPDQNPPVDPHWCMKNNERIAKANEKVKVVKRQRNVYQDKDIVQVDIRSEPEKQVVSTREVFVILGEQVDFSNVRVKRVPVPIYGKVQSKKKLGEDMVKWCEAVQQAFGSRRALDNVFLLNQVSIQYLSEIPGKCNVLMVSRGLTVNFWSDLVEFHRLDFFKKEHLNLILEIINGASSVKELRQFLYARDKWQVIELDESDQLIEKYSVGLWQMEKDLVQVKKANGHQVKEAVDQSEQALNHHQCLPNDLLAIKQHSLSDSSCNMDFEQVVDKILKHFEDETQIKQDNLKLFWEKIETEYYLHNNEISKQNRKKLIDNRLKELLCLEFDTQRIQAITPKKDNIYIYQWEEEKGKETSKNFIRDNVSAVMNPTQRIVTTINRMYPLLCEMNVPKMESKFNFSRKDLHFIYSRFKSLVQLNALDNPTAEIGAGVDFDTFRKGVTQQFGEAHEELIKKMFYSENKDVYMKWKAYLQIVSSLKVNSLETKLSMFFTLMDTNKNGLLSYSQIENLCRLSLQKLMSVTKEEADSPHFIDQLAEYLADLIFKYFKAKKDDPEAVMDVAALKELLTSDEANTDILLLMCCAEKPAPGKQPNEQDINEQIKASLPKQDHLYKKYGSKPPQYYNHLQRLKNKFEQFTPELNTHLQTIIGHKRLNCKDYLNDQAALLEAKLLMTCGILPAFL